MIFSLLKIRKKTSAVIAGILIGAACLWGIAMWQGISTEQLFNLFLGSFALIVAIMLLAVVVIAIVKLTSRLLRRVFRTDDDSSDW